MIRRLHLRHSRRPSTFDTRSVLLFASLTLGAAGAFAGANVTGRAMPEASTLSSSSRTDSGERGTISAPASSSSRSSSDSSPFTTGPGRMKPESPEDKGE
jgi:hypothetical protein